MAATILKCPEDKLHNPLVAAIALTLPFIPRTKKTHQRVVRVGKFTKVLPSKAFEDYERQCVQYSPNLHRSLRARGVSLPITTPVSVRAIFYRDANRGDWCGFATALGDVLQEIGVIDNDVLIQHWDGSRLMKDAKFPRTEIWIEPAGEQEQEELFSER